MEGLAEDSDYNVIKQTHIDFVEKHTNSQVLYYKLYRNQKYLNCGDMTIDTKDALDALLNTDAHKEFDLGDGLTGVFYRYNRKGRSEDNNETSNVESV